MELTDISNRRKAGAAAAAVFLVALALYLLTMPPDAGWGDGADFVLSSYYLGVAHPTGYPLFTLLGKIFLWLPAGGAAFRVALISVVSGAGAAAVFFLLASRLAGMLPALYAVVVLSTSTFLWRQAVSIEVYTLNLLFCACMLMFAAPVKKGGLRGLLALVFVACVGLGNHGTLILPALALGVAGIITERKKFLPAAVGSAFLIGLCFTLYACLPLFSARADLFDWNMAERADSFRVLLSGLDFWVIGEYKPDVMWANTKLLAGSVGRQAWPFLLAGFFVAVFMKPESKSLKWTFTAALLMASFFPILYPTLEKESFFLIAFSVILLMGAVGIDSIFRRMRERGNDKPAAGAAALSVVLIAITALNAAFLLSVNGKELSGLSRDGSAGKYSEQIMKSARRDALVFIDHVADDTIAAPLYFQFLRGARRDAFLFHRLYLAFPWYRDYMRARAAATGDSIAIPQIDMQREKNENYRISLQEYNRLMEGKTLNTVSIDIQTKKIYDANRGQRAVYINSPARFRKSVLADDVPARVSGFIFALGESEKRRPPDAPAPLGGIYDAVIFDYYSEAAYLRIREKDVRGYAANLQTALGYSDQDWVYGELAGAYRELGDTQRARQYEEEYAKRKRIDDIFKP